MENSKAQEVDRVKQRLIVATEELCSIAGNNGHLPGDLLKELDEVRWYLGEERERRQQLERTLQEKDARVQQLEEQLGVIRKQLDEAQWFLGEERSKVQELQNQAGSR